MNFGMGFTNILNLFRAAPTEAQLAQQAVHGGAGEQVRDKLVKDERHKRSVQLAGTKAANIRTLNRLGVTKPSARPSKKA